MNINNEVSNIKERYSRRETLGPDRYSPLAPHTIMTRQEKERALSKWIKRCGIKPVENKQVIEIGCGNGSSLVQLLNLGFKPENLHGNELLPERISSAVENLPSKVTIHPGNALDLDFNQKFDIVYQSMVFSSILNKEFKKELADRMLRWVKPGGGILWYDFIYNNPKNSDVNGIPFKEITTLFSGKRIIKWKITLAPPLSRAVSRINPVFYTIFNALPFLRTHLLCWIKK